MLKHFWGGRGPLLAVALVAAAAALLTAGACAKRNPAWQEPDVLTLAREIPVVGNPLDMSFAGDNLYVAQDQGGISVINVNDYNHKWVTQVFADDGSSITLGRIKRISLLPVSNRMFLNEISATDRIVILDTSDPDTLVYKFDIVGGTGGIKDLGSFPLDPPSGGFNMAIGYCSGGVFKYDRYDGGVFNENVYTLTPPASASGYYLTDDKIYLTCEQRGLFIYNRSDRQYLGELALPGEAQKVAVSGNFAYVACRQGGLSVVDVTNPAQPVLAGSYDTTGYATSIDVSGSLAAVSSGSGGTYLFDVSTPTAPTLIQRLTEAGYTNNAKIKDGKLYVAARDRGILIYDID